MEQQCNTVHRVLCSGWVWRKEGYQVSHVLAAAVAACWIDVRYICILVSFALNRDALHLQFQSSLLAFSLACSLLTDEQHSCTLHTLLWSRVSVPRVSLSGLSIGITSHYITWMRCNVMWCNVIPIHYNRVWHASLAGRANCLRSQAARPLCICTEAHTSVFLTPEDLYIIAKGLDVKTDVLLKVDQTQMYGPYIKLHR